MTKVPFVARQKADYHSRIGPPPFGSSYLVAYRRSPTLFAEDHWLDKETALRFEEILDIKQEWEDGQASVYRMKAILNIARHFPRLSLHRRFLIANYAILSEVVVSWRLQQLTVPLRSKPLDQRPPLPPKLP